jgi:4-hydroxy-4-methyl-2-oxoglutarate aldolase
MIDQLKSVNTCDVSDALDAIGVQSQMLGISPLWKNDGSVVGRAVTMKLHPQARYSTVIGTLEAIEIAEPGDILVLDNDGRIDINSFGSIAAYCAQSRGSVGCVIDGATRDVDDMENIGFPAFGKGIVQTSVRHRTGFVGYQIPVRCGGVDVAPGDFVMADANGAVAIPADKLSEVVELALFFREMEGKVKAAVDAGESPVAVHKRLKYDRSFEDLAPRATAGESSH